jgi:hypothetical protein
MFAVNAGRLRRDTSLVALAVAVVFVLTSCVDPPDSPLTSAKEVIGTWSHTDAPAGARADHIVFNADGTVHLDRVPGDPFASNKQDLLDVTGIWTINEGLDQTVVGKTPSIDIEFVRPSPMGGSWLDMRGAIGDRILFFTVGDPDQDVRVDYRKDVP